MHDLCSPESQTSNSFAVFALEAYYHVKTHVFFSLKSTHHTNREVEISYYNCQYQNLMVKWFKIINKVTKAKTDGFLIDKEVHENHVKLDVRIIEDYLQYNYLGHLSWKENKKDTNGWKKNDIKHFFL